MSKLTEIKQKEQDATDRFAVISKYRTIYQKQQNQETITKAINRALKDANFGSIYETDKGFYFGASKNTIDSDLFKEPEEVLAFLLTALVKG